MNVLRSTALSACFSWHHGAQSHRQEGNRCRVLFIYLIQYTDIGTQNTTGVRAMVFSFSECQPNLPDVQRSEGTRLSLPAATGFSESIACRIPLQQHETITCHSPLEQHQSITCYSPLQQHESITCYSPLEQMNLSLAIARGDNVGLNSRVGCITRESEFAREKKKWEREKKKEPKSTAVSIKGLSEKGEGQSKSAQVAHP
jgi:hypothetical protein